jgi:hypothetical protein
MGGSGASVEDPRSGIGPGMLFPAGINGFTGIGFTGERFPLWTELDPTDRWRALGCDPENFPDAGG